MNTDSGCICSGAGTCRWCEEAAPSAEVIMGGRWQCLCGNPLRMPKAEAMSPVAIECGCGYRLEWRQLARIADMAAVAKLEKLRAENEALKQDNAALEATARQHMHWRGKLADEATENLEESRRLALDLACVSVTLMLGAPTEVLRSHLIGAGKAMLSYGKLLNELRAKSKRKAGRKP